ncbi:MAG: polyprenol monophosphomannose synthase [Spirochaetes bacterium]|nr:polyprenol monophosphomannose synthase [Spirochaetota bacterium]
MRIPLAIVIPTYNERENLGQLIPLLFKLQPKAHVFIADDNSPDRTGDLVESLGKRKYPGLHLIRRPRKEGIGRAYLDAFSRVLSGWNPDLIVQMDADFSHDPAAIASLVAKSKEADVVIGSRYVRGISVLNWPLQRLLLSYFANVYIRLVTRLPVRDGTGGFKCWRREVLEHLNLSRITSDGYSFQIEMNYGAWRLGFRLAEVPIVFADRTEGVSKMSRRIVYEALFKVLRLPLRSTRSFGKAKAAAVPARAAAKRK